MATAFVDWNAQLHNSGLLSETRVSRRIELATQWISERIANTLSIYQRQAVYTVSMRLYYGWSRGFTPTEDRLVLKRNITENDLPGRKDNVIFDWSRAFGDEPLSCLPHRAKTKLSIALPNTLREQTNTMPTSRSEKMVDTALVSDLLCESRSNPGDWKLVLSEDDDVVPGVFTAESWSKQHQGKVMLLRKRPACKFLRLEGLLK